jgi:hypothetical protein
MERKTKKRILISIIAVISIFYVLPFGLSWYGSRLAFNGHDYKNGREYASQDFKDGLKLIRFTSHFPGFGSKCEMLIRVYLDSYTMGYYVDHDLMKRDYCMNSFWAFQDSVRKAVERDDTMHVRIYNRQKEEWQARLKDVLKVQLPRQMMDSFCVKWQDVTLLLKELGEEKYHPVEECK